MTTIESILTHCQTIAVVGLSPKVDRDSYRVAAYMQAQGYRIIPINPQAQHILGETCYASLSEAAVHESIDLVNCFRRSEEIAPIAQESIRIAARALWLQMGIFDPTSLTQAQAAGLWAVQNLCLMVEHRRWIHAR